MYVHLHLHVHAHVDEHVHLHVHVLRVHVLHVHVLRAHVYVCVHASRDLLLLALQFGTRIANKNVSGEAPLHACSSALPASNGGHGPSTLGQSA